MSHFLPYLTVLLILIYAPNGSEVKALSLRNVSIPSYVMKDGRATLSCDFILTPSDKLLFLQWYKDDAVFYRYTPSSPEPILTFAVEGVTVDPSESNFNQVTLRNLSLRTSGSFRCEAMAEGTFQSPSGSGSMDVIAPPETLPVITGVHPLVNLGDRVQGNCTSFRSRPAAVLTFYVNGKALNYSEVTDYPPQEVGPNGLENSVLGFAFTVEGKHFRSKRGMIELKCTATILNLYGVRTQNISLVNINAQPSYTSGGGQKSRLAGSGSNSGIGKSGERRRGLVILWELGFVVYFLLKSIN